MYNIVHPQKAGCAQRSFEKNNEKIKKSFKKVLTKGKRSDIISKLSQKSTAEAP